ncbi:UNVERIFIED_CONTAM: hypothetical protein HDU68_012544, partial [Siphonaria sp. JEL0065]
VFGLIFSDEVCRTLDNADDDVALVHGRDILPEFFRTYMIFPTEAEQIEKVSTEFKDLERIQKDKICILVGNSSRSMWTSLPHSQSPSPLSTFSERKRILTEVSAF